jgi:di/tripeptidase
MQEIHGPLEWVSLQDMAAATSVTLELIQLWVSPESQAPAAL